MRGTPKFFSSVVVRNTYIAVLTVNLLHKAGGVLSTGVEVSFVRRSKGLLQGVLPHVQAAAYQPLSAVFHIISVDSSRFASNASLAAHLFLTV
jgi:hypothetical protein